MALAHAQPTPKPRHAQLPPPSMVFAKLPFKGLATERESRMHAPERECDPQLARIVDAWKKFEADYDSLLGFAPFERLYVSAVRKISDISCSAGDLQAFMDFISICPVDRDFAEKVGIFVSALINAGSDARYVIRTDHLDARLDYVGANNKTKHIVVKGSVGNWAGFCMGGGILTVEENADDGAGNEMAGGIVTIQRNAGGAVGAGMKGGIIYIYGQHEAIGTQKQGGQIFVGGIQVHPSPRPKLEFEL